MSAGALIEAISTTGSSTAAGLPNVNGQVFAYVPGTTTPTTIYSDAAATVVVTQPVILDNAGRVPYATYPNGLYCTGPIRLFITDVNGSTVSDTTYQLVSGLVAINNSNFTGTSLDAILNAAGTSFGGQDFKYLGPGTGATARLVKSKFQEILISVVDQGADPTGVALSTTAIQNAVNAVIALGGGVVYFPPGTYKINAAITLAANTGVTLRGAGASASIINQVTISTDIFTVSASTGLVIEKLGSTGGGVTLNSAATALVNSCSITSNSNYAVKANGGNYIIIKDTTLGATSEALLMIGAINVQISGGSLAGSVSIVIQGTNNGLYCTGAAQFSGSTGIQWASGSTGSGFIVTDCPSLGTLTTPIDVSALSNVDPGITLRNVGMEFILQDNLIADAGHSVTPNNLYGTSELRVTSASGGASITVNPPTPTPTSAQKGKVFSTYHVNNSGSGVTWVFPAGAGQYLTNVSIPTLNNTKFNMSWKWDGSNWNLNSSGQAV